MKKSTAIVALALPVLAFIGTALAFQPPPPCLSQFDALLPSGHLEHDPLYGWTLPYSGIVELSCDPNPAVPKPAYFCQYCVKLGLYSRPLPSTGNFTLISGTSFGDTYAVGCSQEEDIYWSSWYDISDDTPAQYRVMMFLRKGPCFPNMVFTDYPFTEDVIIDFDP